MTTEINFAGRVAVITGAGGGIGRAHALLLASRGALIVVNDYGTDLEGAGNSSRPADQVVAEIQAAGGTAVANYDGVHTADGAEGIVQTAIDHFGRIDILICNAGIFAAEAPLDQTTDDAWRRTLGVHLDGSMFTARAAWSHMKKAGYGRVIFTCSTGAIYGKDLLTPYCAAKGGIFGLMRGLAQEVGKDDIRVNAILPGAATRMVLEESRPLWDSRPGLGDAGHVSPLVACLAHHSCMDNGRLYVAGAGFYARNEIMESPGIRFPHATPATPEQVAHAWSQINDMEKANGFDNAMTHGAHMFGWE